MRGACSSEAFSIGHNAFRGTPAPAWPYPWLRTLQGVPGLSWANSRPHALRCSIMPSCTATDASSVPAATWTCPQPQMLRGIPSPVWTCSWATVPSEVYLLRHRHNHGHTHFEIYLLWHALIHGHRRFGMSCSCMGSSTGHSSFNLSSHWSSSLSSRAAQKQQWCPGHLPAQAHHHCCSQSVPRHSKVRW